MNATLEDVTKKKPEPTAEAIAAEQMVRRRAVLNWVFCVASARPAWSMRPGG